MKRMLCMAAVAALLAGCGAGSTGGIVAKPDPVLEVETRAATTTTVLYAAEMTVWLPPGVSVPADPDGEVSAQALTPKVPGTFAGGHFTAATANTPPLLRLNVANPQGVTVGPLVAVTCNMPEGSATTADFSIEGFSARNQSGVTLAGITPFWSFTP